MDRDEKREYLKGYIEGTQEIERIADEIYQLQGHANMLEDLQHGLQRTVPGIDTQDIGRAAVQLNELCTRLRDRAAEIDAGCMEIFNCISAAREQLGLQKYRILFDVYICGMNMEQAAEDTGYSTGHAARLLSAALDALNI